MNILASYIAVSELHIIAMYYSYIGVDIVLLKINVELIFVTGRAKRDQVGTKYTKSQNGTFVELCVQ